MLVAGPIVATVRSFVVDRRETQSINALRIAVRGGD
jgi:hypothetical protein